MALTAFRNTVVLIMLQLLVVLNAQADASPKYTEYSSIYITDSLLRPIIADSIVVLCEVKDTSYYAYLKHNTAEFWTRPTLDQTNDHYSLTFHGTFSSFKVILFFNGKRFESDEIRHFYANNEYRFRLVQDRIVNESNIFIRSWRSYFIALLITLGVEIFLGLIFFFFRKNKVTIGRWISVIVLVNLITHFTLWTVYCHSDVSIFTLELVVVILEAYAYRTYLYNTTARAIGMSFVLNLFSFVIGVLITF